MSLVKNAVIEILSCSICEGRGWFFFGRGQDYDVESCECNPFAIPTEEIKSARVYLVMNGVQ